MDRLSNTIRPYAWGSTTAIPRLLGTEPTGEPQAELWMGAHPGAPSRVDRGTGSAPLTEVIAADPDRALGAPAVRAFGPALPFLLKVLAADAPLSLQVHPDRTQAEAGFADEEARGVPADAPERTYKDANHKPELICALTPFDGLCGFRPAAVTADLIDGLGVDSLKPWADILRAAPEGDALREVLTAVLTADPDTLADTVHRAAEAAGRLAADDPDGPYAVWAGIARHYPGDPGVIAAMLLNHVRLRPGQALFLGAGVPHAYLSGLGVEIMANSDNVLRCGLTPKHIDVPELLRIVRFEATDPAVLGPADDDAPDHDYTVPVDDFRLSRHVLSTGAPDRDLPAGTPQILLCTAGEVHLRADDGSGITLAPGQSVWAAADERVTASGAGTLFRATVTV
ncbi:mannose-6-phosphate isomerase, class I [Streptomyces sp. RFCAC02]|uniref:mannose-6-phosphate isomerase, class I n=1 Tax=Streptomyces sp. RFCAC02 TaxID=2499143 RepID=UPI00101FA6C4|nr:mannose-6-phosphate isomerase, class I [Streptomyces sp. RFCAC02]